MLLVALTLVVAQLLGCGSAATTERNPRSSGAGAGHRGGSLAAALARHRRAERHRRRERLERRMARRRAARQRVRQTAGGIVVGTCSYTNPASSVCGRVPPPGACHLRDHGALQDPRCTPGAIDSRVTQADLDRTICRPGGYTDSVRPPTSYTDPLEVELLRACGLQLSPSQTELDHLISLELGGAPSDPRNLFPEPYGGSRGAAAKDAFENELHARVCDGTLSLAAAQHEIVDWVKYAPASATSTTTQQPPSTTAAGGTGDGN
jgi:hypothetical protein